MKTSSAKSVSLHQRIKPPDRAFIRALLPTLLAATLLSFACSPQEKGASRCREKPPERIVSLMPSTTEILGGVGAFERVVAVSDYCQYPPGVERLPRVGGWLNTNFERVAALRPDLIVLTDLQAPFVKDRFERLGICTLTVKSRTLDDALAAINEIGRATGSTDQAQRLLNETRAQLDEVRNKTQNLSRPRVLCVVDRAPGTLRDIYIATEDSFIAQLIEIAGGDAVAPPSASGCGQISKEALVSLNPDIIIDMVQGAEVAGVLAEDSKAVWREFEQVQAVKMDRVYPMRDASVLHASQFVGATARRFAELIHPEVFGGETRR